MSRRRRTAVSALVASLALLATLPAPCGCLLETVAVAEHACCAPPPGLRAAEPGCCTAPVVTPDAAATASGAKEATLAPALVVVAWVAPLVTPAHDRGLASPGPAASPPLTVRRL